jgi:hypothetical protein
MGIALETPGDLKGVGLGVFFIQEPLDPNTCKGGVREPLAMSQVLAPLSPACVAHSAHASSRDLGDPSPSGPPGTIDSSDPHAPSAVAPSPLDLLHVAPTSRLPDETGRHGGVCVS